MITKENYLRIWGEVKECVDDALDSIKSKSESNYILLLANGEYNELYMRRSTCNPNTIECSLDNMLDYDRLEFLTDFLQTFYSFDGFGKVEDDVQRLHMELMIYTHIWESQPFLKKMYRIAHSLKGDRYAWSVSVPRQSRQEFIRKEITLVLRREESCLSEIIKKGFHSSLRNAFAHSQYYFSLNSDVKSIHLANFGGRSWELRDIGLDDWSVRFVYSALLTYHLYHSLKSRKENIVEEFNRCKFIIDWPSRDGVTILEKEVVFKEKKKEFYFAENLI